MRGWDPAFPGLIISEGEQEVKFFFCVISPNSSELANKCIIKQTNKHVSRLSMTSLLEGSQGLAFCLWLRRLMSPWGPSDLEQWGSPREQAVSPLPGPS